MHDTQFHDVTDCSIKSSHLESSQLSTSRRSCQSDPLNVPPPSTFLRKQRKYALTHIPQNCQTIRHSIATIRHFIASEIADCESACWSESPNELREWYNKFRALEICEVQ